MKIQDRKRLRAIAALAITLLAAIGSSTAQIAPTATPVGLVALNAAPTTSLPASDILVTTYPDTSPTPRMEAEGGVFRRGSGQYDACAANLRGLAVAPPAAVPPYYMSGRSGFRLMEDRAPVIWANSLAMPTLWAPAFPCSFDSPAVLLDERERPPQATTLETGTFVGMRATLGRATGHDLVPIPMTVDWFVFGCDPATTSFKPGVDGMASRIEVCGSPTPVVRASRYVQDLTWPGLGTSFEVPTLDSLFNGASVGSRWIVSCVRTDVFDRTVGGTTRYSMVAHDWFMGIDPNAVDWALSLALSKEQARWYDMSGGNGCPITLPPRTILPPSPAMPCGPTFHAVRGPPAPGVELSTATEPTPAPTSPTTPSVPRYLGGAEVVLTPGMGRTIARDRIDAPSSWVTAHSRDVNTGGISWHVAPVEPGLHRIHVELDTHCITPYYGTNEFVDLVFEILVPEAACVLWKPEAAGPNYRFLVGLSSLPSGVAPGSIFHGSVVSRVLDSPARLYVEVSQALYPVFSRDVTNEPGLRYCIQDAPIVTYSATPSDTHYASGVQYAPTEINMEPVWDNGYSVTGLASDKILCIVDTGLDDAHPDIDTTRLTAQYDAITDTVGGAIDDWHGHGTFVTAIATADTNNAAGIAGIVEANYMFARIGYYTIESMMGVQWCAEDGADVINLSSGVAPDDVDPAVLADFEEAWEDVLDNVDAAGALLVAAAGNTPCPGEDCIAYPARYATTYDNVMAIGCKVEASIDFCSFASEGPAMSVIAPGDNMMSACPDTLPMCDHTTPPCSSFPANYCEQDGTSFSAPLVSGVATYIWSHAPALGADQVRDYIECTTYWPAPVGPPPTATWGWGIVQADDALAAAVSGSCTPPSCTGYQVLESDGTTVDAGDSFGGAAMFSGGHPGTSHLVGVSAVASDGATVIKHLYTEPGYAWLGHDGFTVYVGDTNTRTITVTLTFTGGCTATASWTHYN